MSFQEEIITIGTGVGQILFFDLRAGRYLESGCGHTCTLELSKGWLVGITDKELIKTELGLRKFLCPQNFSINCCKCDFICLLCGLTSQSIVFQLCQDGATASCVL